MSITFENQGEISESQVVDGTMQGIDWSLGAGILKVLGPASSRRSASCGPAPVVSEGVPSSLTLSPTANLLRIRICGDCKVVAGLGWDLGTHFQSRSLSVERGWWSSLPLCPENLLGLPTLTPRDGNGGSEPARAEGLACQELLGFCCYCGSNPCGQNAAPTGLAWRLRLTQPHVTQESVQ